MKVLVGFHRLNLMSYKVSYKRHLAKTVSYRIVSTTIGFLGMWWATGSIKLGAAFGIVELVYKPVQYYIHERVWYKWIKYGLVPDKKTTKKETKKDTTQEVLENVVTELKKPTPPPTKILAEGENPKKKVLNYSSNR